MAPPVETPPGVVRTQNTIVVDTCVHYIEGVLIVRWVAVYFAIGAAFAVVCPEIGIARSSALAITLGVIWLAGLVVLAGANGWMIVTKRQLADERSRILAKLDEEAQARNKQHHDDN